MISHVTERLSKSCLLSPTALFVNCPEVDDGSMRSVFSVVKENDHYFNFLESRTNKHISFEVMKIKS